MSQGSQPVQPTDNPFLIGVNTNAPPPPEQFRRHGNAEQGFSGGLGCMGITPPGTPPRSRYSCPRESPRAPKRRKEQEEEDEPPARRDRDRERSRDGNQRQNSPEANMPTEWGGRTLRLQQMVQASVAEIKKLNSLPILTIHIKLIPGLN